MYPRCYPKKTYVAIPEFIFLRNRQCYKIKHQNLVTATLDT